MLRVIAFLLLCTVSSGAVAAANILVFGDSISAGYGIDPEQGWVRLLQERLDAAGYEFHVINASVSGETTTGGLARLPRALARHEPRVVILELGANDGLRGLPLTTTRSNLRRMIDDARKAGSSVLLAGMQMPPNYGARYTGDFRKLFPDLARELKVKLVPFLMEGVALHPDLMQADGLHPNAAGQPLLLENVWPVLRPMLQNGPGSPGGSSR